MYMLIKLGVTMVTKAKLGTPYTWAYTTESVIGNTNIINIYEKYFNKVRFSDYLLELLKALLYLRKAVGH